MNSRWLHITTNLMIAVITVGNMWAAARLVRGILTNAKFTDAEDLLQIGASVWLVNVIAFVPVLASRQRRCRLVSQRQHRVSRAFVFPESDLPTRRRPLVPAFVDYLAMSFNTATAFSPTDVSAVKPWAKLLVMAESSVSLVVALLVIARAINIFPAAGS